MFCYKLKEKDSYNSRYVEGYNVQKYEWLLSNIKIDKLELSLLVDSNKFDGYCMPESLKLVKPVEDNSIESNKKKGKSNSSNKNSSNSKSNDTNIVVDEKLEDK